MTCPSEVEPCLDTLENRESPTSPTALYQTKATMHKWRRLTGAGVEHSRPLGQS